MTLAPKVIRVRELATDVRFNLPEYESALRVPSDASDMVGAASYREEDNTIRYAKRTGEALTGRAARAILGSCKPGEHVLIRHHSLGKAESEYSLCEVESINGGDIA